jgi:hypothetical protein
LACIRRLTVLVAPVSLMNRLRLTGTSPATASRTWDLLVDAAQLRFREQEEHHGRAEISGF